MIMGKYIISYNLNGGTDALLEQIKVKEMPLVIQSAIPTKTGYAFRGWSLSADGDAEYSAGSTFMVDEDTTLYAVWKKQCAVMFNLNGGSGVENQIVCEGEKAIEPAAPIKTGCIFKGWFTDVSRTTEFNFNSEINDDITLYAKWSTIIANGTCGDNLTWSLDDTGTLTISGTGKMLDAWSYNNGAYVSSGLPWKTYTNKIKSVVIENGATTIGKGAFKDCSVLTSVIIPQSVIDIGEQAFRNCPKLSDISVSLENTAYVSIDDVLFDKHQTTLIAYPTGKTSTSYIIPDGVTKIDDYAFSGCTSLLDVTIPDNVTIIGDYAFSNCTSLTSISIPDSVTSIGSHSFSYCKGLKNVYISDIETWCSFSFGDYYSNPLYWGGKLYLNKQLVTELVIPEGITKIGNYAFSGYTSLTSVTIPDSVTSISYGAFYYCESLERVVLPNGIKTLDGFASCPSLTSVIIPDSVTTISSGAFNYCESLESIVIPESVKIIDEYAFDMCPLKYITYKGLKRDWDKIKIEFGNDVLSREDISSKVFYEKTLISYNLNGGTGTFPEQIKNTREPIYLYNTIPQKSGHEFKGWSTTLNGVPEYSSGASYSGDTDTVLYAVWGKITYEVTYDSNGGTGKMANSSHTYDISGNLNVNTFIKTGYSFKGWATSRNGNVEYNDGASVKNLSSEPNGNVNLYAVWEANTYTISYNANGGKGNMENSNHVYNAEKFLNFNQFKKTGYTFKGWAISESGAIVYEDGDSIKNLTSTNGDIIYLYAVWEANIYAVSYNANGGVGAMASSAHTYDVYGVLNTNTFTKMGYTFKGWSTIPTGTIAFNDRASIVNLASDANANVNLYAVWEANTYTITYNANGGEGNMASSNHVYDIEKPLSPNQFIKTGYTFSGWDIIPTGIGIYTNADSVKNLTDDEGDNITLYAVWKVNNYSVSYDANGGNGSMSSSEFVYDSEGTLKFNAFARTGYTFKGWAISPSGNVVYNDGENVTNLSSEPNGNISLYAVWEANTYTITYYANGGDGEEIISVHTYDTGKELSQNTFSKTGHSFQGWTTSADGNVVYMDGAIVLNLISEQNGNINLYAVWQPNTYTISYNANGGVLPPSDQSGLYGASINLSNILPTRTGYTCKGWATSPSGNAEYAAGEVYYLDSDIVLYAVWEVNKYSISYNANGGSGSMDSSVHKYDESKFLNANRFGRLGYEFVGWDDTPTGAGKYVDCEEVNNLTAEQNGEITLYAIWKANEYSISYNANGGSGIVRDSNHIYDQTLNLNDNNFIRIGYIFRGWSKSASGTVVYTDKQSVSNLTPINNDNITLYAVWEPGCELYVNGNKVTFKSQQPIYGKIIIALYNKDGKMKEMQPYDAVDGIDINFSNLSTGDYVKVLCWESITTAKPMFEAQEIILK